MFGFVSKKEFEALQKQVNDLQKRLKDLEEVVDVKLGGPSPPPRPQIGGPAPPPHGP